MLSGTENQASYASCASFSSWKWRQSRNIFCRFLPVPSQGRTGERGEAEVTMMVPPCADASWKGQEAAFNPLPFVVLLSSFYFLPYFSIQPSFSLFSVAISSWLFPFLPTHSVPLLGSGIPVSLCPLKTSFNKTFTTSLPLFIPSFDGIQRKDNAFAVFPTTTLLNSIVSWEASHVILGFSFISVFCSSWVTSFSCKGYRLLTSCSLLKDLQHDLMWR